MKNFERGALGSVAALVVVLVAAAYARPPAPVTASPKAVLTIPAVAQEIPAPGKIPPGALGALARHLPPATVSKLSNTFSSIGYDLDSVLSGDDRVPRLFLASLPTDMGEVREVKVRKALFFQTVLPLILQVNEEILAERRRLWQLRTRQRMGLGLAAVDRLWLAVMAERYGTERGDIGGLLHRIDVIPPSLALAQAAEESGWGTSRFVREGNALFGQWTFSRDGDLTPRRRDAGKKHSIRAFASLLDSARAYARNLNRHRAYAGLRKARAAMRRAGAPLDGAVLAKTLLRYSQRGRAYVASIRAIIAANRLRGLDDARLHDAKAVSEPSV